MLLIANGVFETANAFIANGESVNRRWPHGLTFLLGAASRFLLCCMGAARCVGPPGDTFFAIYFKSYLFCSWNR